MTPRLVSAMLIDRMAASGKSTNGVSKGDKFVEERSQFSSGEVASVSIV
jgi:hypothetical protein